MEAENRVWPPATRPNVLSLHTDTEVHATEGAADATPMYVLLFSYCNEVAKAGNELPHHYFLVMIHSLS